MLKKIVFLAVAVLLGATPALAAGKTLRVAHDATWPPMEYINTEKQLVGYSVDYIDAIAKEVGVEVEHRNVAWAGIFSELDAGRTDVIASSVTITKDRMNAMAFTEPYYTVQQAVVTRKGAEYTSTDDLKDKRLGAQISTTGYFAGRKLNRNIKSYDAVGYAIEDLKNGNLDAVLCDDPVAADFALKAGGNNAEMLQIAFVITDAEEEHYGFAVRKNDKETLDLLNRGIRAVKEKGIEAELIKKWIGK